MSKSEPMISCFREADISTKKDRIQRTTRDFGTPGLREESRSGSLRWPSFMRRWTIPILVALSGSPHLESQQTAPSTKVSYEGETVAAVELVANPKISVDSLGVLVQQRSGEPYSTSKVESTISALEETGRFSKVEVEVKPDPGGLHVTFTLEPALYFGTFDFPGATKNFSYTRLLQVIDIPNQSPYKQDTVSKASAALLQFLNSAGY